MAVSINVSNLKTKLGEAGQALEDGNLDTAQDKLDVAETLLVGLTDGSHGDAQFEWARDQVDNLARRLRQKRARKQGVFRQKINRKPVSG